MLGESDDPPKTMARIVKFLPDGVQLALAIFDSILLRPFCLNTHALSQCATIRERLRRMGMDMHPHRLPRKERDAGIYESFY